ncbi:hypothetical protein D3C73_1645560 [compost metagenome]
MGVWHDLHRPLGAFFGYRVEITAALNLHLRTQQGRIDIELPPGLLEQLVISHVSPLGAG